MKERKGDRLQERERKKFEREKPACVGKGERFSKTASFMIKIVMVVNCTQFVNSSRLVQLKLPAEDGRRQPRQRAGYLAFTSNGIQSNKKFCELHQPKYKLHYK